MDHNNYCEDARNQSIRCSLSGNFIVNLKFKTIIYYFMPMAMPVRRTILLLFFVPSRFHFHVDSYSPRMAFHDHSRMIVFWRLDTTCIPLWAPCHAYAFFVFGRVKIDFDSIICEWRAFDPFWRADRRRVCTSCYVFKLRSRVKNRNNNKILCKWASVGHLFLYTRHFLCVSKNKTKIRTMRIYFTETIEWWFENSNLFNCIRLI